MEVTLVISFVFLNFPKKAHAIHFELARVVSFVFVFQVDLGRDSGVEGTRRPYKDCLPICGVP